MLNPNSRVHEHREIREVREEYDREIKEIWERILSP